MKLRAWISALLGTWALAVGAQDSPGPPTTVIGSVQVQEDSRGAELQLVGSSAFHWSAGLEDDASLVIHLDNARLGPGASDLRFEEGLVRSVEFTRGRPDSSALRMVVRTARRPTCWVSAVGKRLQIRFRPTRQQTSPANPFASPNGGPRSPSRWSNTEAADLGVYRISAGDLLSIEVLEIPELTTKVRVRPDGRIALPLLGRLALVGLTAERAEEKISRVLREAQLLKKPQVLVAIEEFTRHGVSVQGEVAQPGFFPIAGRMTLLEVLGAAGGVVRNQAGSQIIVLRRHRDGSDIKTEIDASRLLEQVDLSLNLELQPGDIVIVPRARQFRIFVTGAVVRPGPLDIVARQGITLLQAITAAGGPGDRAKLSKVDVIRTLADGSQTKITVNLKQVQRGKKPDLPLLENDTIVVRESFL